MKRSAAIIMAFATLLLSVACSPKLTPFTQRLQDENKWSESELKSIQFYLSDDLVLSRDVVRGNSEIVSGEIKIVEGRQVEQVYIRKRTPGVILFMPKENRFAVSFDANDDRRYIIFGPNPKAGSRYTIMASEWDRNNGRVTYEGREWRVSSRNAYTAIMVDLRKMRKVSTRSEKATGRRVE